MKCPVRYMPSWAKPIVPDFSSRGPLPPPPLPSLGLPPPELPPPPTRAPFQYNKGPTIPEWKPNPAPQPVAVAVAVAAAAPPVGLSTGLSTSGFSPSCETFPSLGTSYFVETEENVTQQWADFPAVQAVDLCGNNLDNAGTVFTEELQVASGAIQLTDLSGDHLLRAIGGDLFFDDQLLAKAGDIQDIAAWADYPASADVNLLDRTILASNGPGTEAQVLAKNATGSTEWRSLALSDGPASTVQVSDGSGNFIGNNGFTYGSQGVTVTDQPFSLVSTSAGISYQTANLDANVNIGLISDAPFRPNFTAYVDNFTIGSLVSPTLSTTINSLGGVSINSLVGVAINGGGGVTINGIGGISILGVGVLNIGAGGVIVGGGGILVNAGGIAVNGGGVSIASGGLAVGGGITNFGTSTSAGQPVNIYGTDLNMPQVDTTFGAFYTNRIRAYDNGSGSAQTLSIQGLEELAGTNMVITGVDTINGVPYPPPVQGATGPAGAVQYTDGAGNFQGNAGLIYDGVSKLTNTATGNALSLNDPGSGNGAFFASTSDMNIDAAGLMSLVSQQNISLTSQNAMSVDIAGTAGADGQFLGSDGAGGTVWLTPTAPQEATGPAGAVQYTDGAGNFQGNAGLVYDGVSMLSNTATSNALVLNDTVAGNGINIAANTGGMTLNALDSIYLFTPQQVNIESTAPMVMKIAGSVGADGDVLGSDGAGGTTWLTLKTPQEAGGPAGAVQYNDGTGNFQGNDGLIYNGASRLTNTASTNYLEFNDTGTSIDLVSAGGMNINASGVIGIVAGAEIDITSQTAMRVTIGTDSGSAGQVLGSDGTNGTVWVTPTGGATGPAGAVQYTDGAGNVQGNAGLIYDGASRLTNTASANYLEFNDIVGGNAMDLTAAGPMNLNAQQYIGIVCNGGYIALDCAQPLTVTINTDSGATGQYLGSDGSGNVVWVTPPAAKPVLSKFGSASGALALTAAYQPMATQTFTSTVSAAPVTVSATLNVTNSGGGDALVSARLLINGTAGVVQQLTVPNNHFQQIVCIGGGISAAAGTPFNVIIQALTVGGTVTRVNACITSIAQTTLSA